MSNAFTNAVLDTQNTMARTDNGALTLASSMDAAVDLFFLAGASRGKDITNVFVKAFVENPEVAARIALWTRDVLGGAGERDQFRRFLLSIVDMDRDLARRVARKIPEVGRFDDLFCLFNGPLHQDAVDILHEAIRSGNGLCAKWLPRKGPVAAMLRQAFGMSPKQYRKTLVALSKTVEQQMCANDWSGIEFQKVPSRAFNIYSRAFRRHEPLRFDDFVNQAKEGKVKVNAGAIFPHDIVYECLYGDSAAAAAQWQNLPDYTAESDGSMLVVADVSGSMGTMNRRRNGPEPMLVSVSLGLYAATFLKGQFKDYFMTFSESPKLLKVKGDLAQKIKTISKADWGYSTNLQAVFGLVLSAAINNDVPQEDMPSKIVIISDMEFNEACSGGRSVTNYQAIQDKYAAAGYKMPQLVFWNVNGRTGNVPVKYNQNGVALVSGYSPTIMKSLVSGDIASPAQMMYKTIMSDRYNL